MAEKLYNTTQVAELLGAARAEIESWIETGWLQSEPLPGGSVAVSEQDLVRFLKDRGVDLEAIVGTVETADEPETAGTAPPEPESGPVPEEDKTPPPGEKPAIEAKPAEPSADAGAATPPELTAEEKAYFVSSAPPAETPPQPAARSASQESETAELGDDALGKLLTAILADAIDRRADTIHLVPRDESLTLKLEVDGRLYEKPNFASRLPDGWGPKLVRRLGSSAAISPGKTHRGALTVDIHGKARRFEVAMCRTDAGRRLTLTRPPRARWLGELGLRAEDLATVRSLLAADRGLLVVAGPAQSGRTTTLSAMVQAVPDRETLAVWTGRGRASAHGAGSIVPAAPGATAEAIRTAADQRPGLLLVDEITDGLAAAEAVSAAARGLVLATVASTVPWPNPRLLIGPDVDAYALGSVIIGVTVQRLVRRPCPACADETSPAPDLVGILGVRAEDGDTVLRPSGCRDCGGTGYAGRTGMFSVFAVQPDVAERVRAGTDSETLHRLGRRIGIESLREAGWAAARGGDTTPEEVARVLGLGR